MEMSKTMFQNGMGISISNAGGSENYAVMDLTGLTLCPAFPHLCQEYTIALWMKLKLPCTQNNGIIGFRQIQIDSEGFQFYCGHTELM